MLRKFVDHLGDVLLSVFGVGVIALIAVAAICGSVLMAKATYESVTHWNEPRPWERVQ